MGPPEKHNKKWVLQRKESQWNDGTSTIGGSALGSGQWGMAAIVFAATLVISAIGLWIYKRILRLREEHHHGTD